MPLNRFTHRLLLAITIAASSVSAVAMAAGEAPAGNVVVAKTMPVAVLIWDASATVADLVIARNTGAAGMRKLEAAALDVLAAHAPRLHAKQVELHVQYAPTGVVGAAYQASTFANATRLLELKAQTADVIRRHAGWSADIAAQRSTPGLTLHVDAALPTPQ